RTTDEMRDQAFFSDFDFINIWQLLGNANFPILQDNLQSPGPGFIITEGDGSSGDPFQVSTIEQLHAIRANLGSNYVLMNDLDLTSASGTEGGKFWNSGNGFEPMGDYGSFFTGNFDGGGFAITGLYMNRANQNYISLFGVITNSAKIQNLGLIDVNITGNYYTAGIAGSLYGYNTTVSNCFITGSITAVGNYTGGLVSTIQEGKVENNFSQLTINSSGNYVGGIVADNASGRVLKNYATGLVTADSDYNGAVIGRNNATASDNYWNTQTGGPDNGVGTGLTTEQMRQQSSFTGFDFENTWETLEDGFSYPYLQGFEYSTLPGALDESFVGRALNFSEGSLVVNDNDVFDDLGTLTIETWFYLDSNKRHGILEKHVTGESGSGWWLDINTDITALFISADGSRAANSTFIPELNTWYHLAVTYDGTTVKLYVNGEDVSSATTGSGSGTILNNTNVINAGRLNWTSSGFMDGKLDEIRIWNSVRTSDQIMENMFQKLNGDESGLIMYLPLDDAFGTSIADKSTTSNTATLDNGVSWIADTHPYGTFITGSEDWRMMSSPFGDASYGSLLDSLWTQGFPGSDSPENGASNVYFWDETAREFTSITNATDIPPQGTGFITFVYDDDNFDGTPDGFPKVIQVDSTQTSGSVSPTLSF
ncbi:MAG: LamG-like jellyroll fold domain-containing protein, partial [Balneolaceae bacterium]